jgi:hypothetical protein
MTALLALFGLTGEAVAKTFEVTRHNDPAPGKCKPNDCSLREALIAANKRDGKDVVLLPDRARYNLSRPNATPFVDEDASAEGDLDVTDRVTLSHPGKGKSTVDGNATDRVLEVQAPTLVKRIKLTGGGNVSDEAPRTGLRTSFFGSGGGIESHSRVILKRSAVVANTGADRGGGITVEPSFEPGAGPASLRLVRSKVARNRTIDGTGGGIEANDANVTITRSRIVGNRPDNAGGAMSIADGSVLRMSRTTVSGNRAGAGVGGVYLYEASGRITQSTISGNSTDTDGSVGGVELSSFTPASVLTITNSTIANNQAAEGGGGVRASGPQASIGLQNVTVARNDADFDNDGGDGGGGLLQTNNATISVVNSLIALNRAGSSPDDCAGAFSSGGGNLLTTIPVTCEGFDPDTGVDFLRPAPKIGTLKANGGPTKTVALKRGSPAIGRAIRSEAPNRDQRGVTRDNNPDIGAYER